MLNNLIDAIVKWIKRFILKNLQQLSFMVCNANIRRDKQIISCYLVDPLQNCLGNFIATTVCNQCCMLHRG